MSRRGQPWGPVAATGHRPGARRRLVWGLLAVLGLAVVGTAALGGLLYLRADDALTRAPVEGLTDDGSAAGDDGTGDGEHRREVTGTDATSFLIVGSDRRDGLEDTEGVATGDFDGQRADAILFVTLSDERDDLSVISLPRDLVVERGGDAMRLGETLQGGPGELVGTVRQALGLDVHHYAQVNFDGFIDAVDTLGGVDMCLDDELVDPDAGADLAAGCQHLAPKEALAFVRSRQGPRSDLARIDRQQQFLRATVDELTAHRLLGDVPRLFDLVEDVAGSVTVDERLETSQLLGLAEEVRGLLDGGVPMTSLPVHPLELADGSEVLAPYAPGTRAVLERVRAGRPVEDPGTPDERADTAVALWSGHRDEALRTVGSTLLFAGFEDRHVAGPGPEDLDAGDTTTVYARPDRRGPAGRVATLLGAPVRDLPPSVSMPDGADAVVAVGRDAAPSTGGRVPGRDTGTTTGASLLLDTRP